MSRQVPLDRALTDDDRRYLRGLGSFGDVLEKRIDASFEPDAEELAAFERAELKRHSEINGSNQNPGQQDLLDENQRLRAEVEALRAQLPPATGPSYDGWSKAKLEAEIDRVNTEDPEAKLSKGKVTEMVTALTEYFTNE